MPLTKLLSSDARNTDAHQHTRIESRHRQVQEMGIDRGCRDASELTKYPKKLQAVSSISAFHKRVECRILIAIGLIKIQREEIHLEV